MNRIEYTQIAPRCGARTRRGGECRGPAVRGGARCRMHGGANSGAPMGNTNAMRHGEYSAAVINEKRELDALARRLAEVPESDE